MQLVPTSGGRDAYRKAKGEDKAPSRDYLFNPENNIELGAAYLNVLTYSQLDNVTDLVSREYCVISAYNTGAGNVFKTFAKDQRAASNKLTGSNRPLSTTDSAADSPIRRPVTISQRSWGSANNS